MDVASVAEAEPVRTVFAAVAPDLVAADVDRDVALVARGAVEHEIPEAEVLAVHDAAPVPDHRARPARRPLLAVDQVRQVEVAEALPQDPCRERRAVRPAG